VVLCATNYVDYADAPCEPAMVERFVTNGIDVMSIRQFMQVFVGTNIGDNNMLPVQCTYLMCFIKNLVISALMAVKLHRRCLNAHFTCFSVFFSLSRLDY
jgi:hypothetical protein